jgi:catechol 2,3-dioxygenase-like lactoylglutathione lyase family enzyme
LNLGAKLFLPVVLILAPVRDRIAPACPKLDGLFVVLVKAWLEPKVNGQTNEQKTEAIMEIKLASVTVDDQEKALRFYTEKLGFLKKTDMSMGQYRWLTVVSPEGVPGVELVLEPDAFPPAKVYQKAKFEAGVPSTAFISKDIRSEYARLKELGVVFRGEPTKIGPITAVLFEDTCGNLVNLVQPPAA